MLMLLSALQLANHLRTIDDKYPKSSNVVELIKTKSATSNSVFLANSLLQQQYFYLLFKRKRSLTPVAKDKLEKHAGQHEMSRKGYLTLRSI